MRKKAKFILREGSLSAWLWLCLFGPHHAFVDVCYIQKRQFPSILETVIYLLGLNQYGYYLDCFWPICGSFGTSFCFFFYGVLLFEDLWIVVLFRSFPSFHCWVGFLLHQPSFHLLLFNHIFVVSLPIGLFYIFSFHMGFFFVSHWIFSFINKIVSYKANMYIQTHTFIVLYISCGPLVLPKEISGILALVAYPNVCVLLHSWSPFL